MNPATQSGDFLARMAARSRDRVAAARASLSENDLLARVGDGDPAPAMRLSTDGFDLIAEVKRRSPAEGELAGAGLDPVVQAEAYAAAGAAALSVLTEPTEFNGDLTDLERVTRQVRGIPAMRKDFIVDRYQVLEAAAAGAGGVLLVAACLDRDALGQLLALCAELRLFALVEVFDEQDLDHCLPVMERAGPAFDEDDVRILLGVNCRNLRNLVVEFARFEKLAPRLPRDYPRVAESGVVEPADAAAVAAWGYDLALVGTALMRAADPAEAAGALLEAGREART